MLFKDGYQFNDGPVGTTQGALETDKSYSYTFKVSEGVRVVDGWMMDDQKGGR